MKVDEADIRSETHVALTEFVPCISIISGCITDMTEHVITCFSKPSDSIILRTRRRNYLIKIENFVKCSEKIATLVKCGKTPATIDLSCYDIGAVRTLTDFIAGVDKRNLRLGDNILADLLQLARIFRMNQFTTLIVEHVIEKVEKGPQSNLLLALHLISSDWSMFLRLNEVSALVESAAENINEVTMSTFFYILPAAVLVMLYSRYRYMKNLSNFILAPLQILPSCNDPSPVDNSVSRIDRCEVDISSELELSQRLINWLKKSIRTDSEAEILFSCIRTPFLSSKDREIIRGKCNGLPKSMINSIENTLNSPRNHRCCVIREHIERRYPRCGIPDSNSYFKINAIDVTTKTIKGKNKKDENFLLHQKHPEKDLATACESSNRSIDSDRIIQEKIDYQKQSAHFKFLKIFKFSLVMTIALVANENENQKKVENITQIRMGHLLEVELWPDGFPDYLKDII
uniref:BACK domain-containing protein n=1 Tax=Elaeophora elaphi TaxID=1147741 RepID=A0A0R3RG35_9BILA